MQRRSALLAIAAVSTGCLGSGNDSDQQYRDSFRARLEAADVEVVSLEQSDTNVSLQYVPNGSQYQELSSEIGTISGEFVRKIENGWNVNRLDGKIVSEGSENIAHWHIKSAWIEEYRNGEIPPDELSLRIIETLEFKNEST